MRNAALVALVAVMCVEALAATSAQASEPLFITESGEALLFTGTSNTVTLRSDHLGTEGTIICEKDSVHGLVLNFSTLARELHIEFKGKCEQTLEGSKGTCTEPIKPVLSYGELGLLKGHVFLLVAPEKGTEFVEVKCTNGNTKIAGAVVGEFTLNGRDGASQYDLAREDFLLLFKAKGITQEPEEIELLGTLMTKVALNTEGLFSGKASDGTVELLLFDGLTQINGPNPPGVVIRPIESNIELGKCPEINARIHFANLGDWCEYELKNNLGQEIEIRDVLPNVPARSECGKATCLVTKKPAAGIECVPRVAKLPANASCWVKLEYVKKPTVANQEVLLYIISIGLSNGEIPISVTRQSVV